jgi:hypothetical protein
MSGPGPSEPSGYLHAPKILPTLFIRRARMVDPAFGALLDDHFALSASTPVQNREPGWPDQANLFMMQISAVKLPSRQQAEI